MTVAEGQGNENTILRIGRNGLIYFFNESTF